jgi:hypothetical protein
MNLGKVGFDPGHYKGQNIGPNGYIEGDAMLKLGLKLRDKYGSFITRDDDKDRTFSERARSAKLAGCNTLISLHSNYPTDGVLVIYSLKHPSDKTIAESIGIEIAKALGIKSSKVWTRPSTHDNNTDYYAMIRQPIDLGIEHVFIVEHGSHTQMSIDTEKKLDAIVECYGKLLDLKPKTSKYEDALNKLNNVVKAKRGTGLDLEYWKIRKDVDVYFDDLLILLAECM